MFAPDVGGPIIGEGAAPSHAAGDFLDDPPVRLRLSRQRQEGSLAADRAVRIGDGAVLFPPSGGGQADLGMRSDRKAVVWGRGVSVRVELGGRRIIKKKKKH